MRNKLLIVIVVSVVAYTAYELLKTPRMETVSPRSMKAVQAVYASGTVEPRLEVPLAPLFAVRVLKIHFDEGDSVSRDSILAEFEFPEFEAQLRELAFQEELARTVFERNKNLFDRSATSREELDRSSTSFKVASAARQRLESVASNYSLRAPFDGTIIRRDAEVGEHKTASDTLFWISSKDGLRVTAEVDEEDMPLVEVEQKVLLRADAFPNSVFDGVVEQVTERGDSVSRSFRVRIGLNENMKLKPGMSVEANIITREVESALMVPPSSIRNGDVLVFHEGSLIPTSVKTGISGKNGIEIISGLSEQSEIAKSWNDVDTSEKRYKPVRVSWE